MRNSLFFDAIEAVERNVLLLLFVVGLVYAPGIGVCAEWDDVMPGNEGSHEAFMDRVEQSQSASYDEIIQIYENRLKSEPSDLVSRIEFCKFLDFAMYDYELEENPLQEKFDSVFAKLIEDFTEEPLVQIYRCSRLYSSELFEAVEELEAGGFENWEHRHPIGK